MMDVREPAYYFLVNGDHQDIIEVLSSAQCQKCRGSGELNDAEDGDISFNTWVCPDCGGKGWDHTAVKEILLNVDDSYFSSTQPKESNNE